MPEHNDLLRWDTATWSAASPVDFQSLGTRKSAPTGDVGANHTTTGLDSPPETRSYGASDYNGNADTLRATPRFIPRERARSCGHARDTRHWGCPRRGLRLPPHGSRDPATRNGTQCRLQATVCTARPTRAPLSETVVAAEPAAPDSACPGRRHPDGRCDRRPCSRHTEAPGVGRGAQSSTSHAAAQRALRSGLRGVRWTRKDSTLTSMAQPTRPRDGRAAPSSSGRTAPSSLARRHDCKTKSNSSAIAFEPLELLERRRTRRA